MMFSSASMSSNLYAFDASSFLTHSSSSDMVSSDGTADLFFSDPSFPFTPNLNQHLLDEILPPLDPFSPSFFSFSPPSSRMENLSLYHPNPNPVPLLSNAPNLDSEIGNFCGLEGFKVKSEESQMGVDLDYAHSYNGAENASKLIQLQRSYSSRSFDGKPGSVFQPHYDTLMDSSNFQSQASSSPENRFFRRVCSTGDLQNMQTTQMAPKEGLFLEEANFKVGRYSAQERKEKISKYRAKRSQRNFNKTIKYACRKTLADNRPRIRGRFARNDESCENPKASSCSARDEDEEEIWFEGLHEEQEDIRTRASTEQYVKGYGGPQFQYYGFGV